MHATSHMHTCMYVTLSESISDTNSCLKSSHYMTPSCLLRLEHELVFTSSHDQITSCEALSPYALFSQLEHHAWHPRSPRPQFLLNLVAEPQFLLEHSSSIHHRSSSLSSNTCTWIKQQSSTSTSPSRLDSRSVHATPRKLQAKPTC